MGIDFDINVNLHTTGKDQVDALEKQIEKLKNSSIKLNVDLSGNGADFTKYFANIEKQAQSAGKNIGNSFQQGFKAVKFNGNSEALIKEFVKGEELLRTEAKKKAETYNTTPSIALKAMRSTIQEQKKIQNQQIKEAEKATNQLTKIQSNVLNGTYSAKNSNFNSKLSPYSNQNSQLLSEARTQAKVYNDELTKLQKHFDSNDSFRMNDKEVIKSFNNMDNAAKKFENTMKEVKNTTSKDLGLGVAERSANEVRAYYESNTKALKKYGAELKDLEQRYKSVKTVAEKAELDNQFKNLKSSISAEGLTGKSRFDELGRSIKQIAEFAGVYNVVRNIAFQIPGQMVEAVKDVNKAQIELIKVSDASNNQLSQYWDEAASSAQKYGATISDVISSTADWSRLGYSLEDAKKLSDATTLLQKVGDNMTQESASQGLISTLKGFNMQADEVGKIVDVANQIANTQPISSAGIFEGLENSASSMSAANNTLEQTISLLTAANSVIQDPSSVGNALKTISMRVRGASTELEQAGLDADGMAESVAKLREEIKALSGVDIMQDENTFKSTYDILDELSTKWKDLTDIQRASVTELIAGKRNGNVVSSLMQNFDIARETLNTALNDSEGSAEKELANYQKGIEYSLDKLQAAFQKFSTTTVNSDFLKGIVDTGTGALNLLDSLIDKFGVFATLGAGVGITKTIMSIA